MAATFTEVADSRQNLGMSGILAVVNVSFAATDYPTGGYPLVPANVGGMSRIIGATVIGLTSTALGWNWQVNSATSTTTKTLIAYGTGAAAGAVGQQAAAATDFSGGTVRLLVYGY